MAGNLRKPAHVATVEEAGALGAPRPRTIPKARPPPKPRPPPAEETPVQESVDLGPASAAAFEEGRALAGHGRHFAAAEAFEKAEAQETAAKGRARCLAAAAASRLALDRGAEALRLADRALRLDADSLNAKRARAPKAAAAAHRRIS